MKSVVLCLIILFSLSLSAFAQGLRGTIKSNDRQVLPFASVYINQLKTGTTANQEGYYEIKLTPGVYKVIVRNIGHKTQEADLEVGSAWTIKDFVLQSQGYMLQEVTVGMGRKEDHAYTIMRKAIASKKYHLLQYNSYEMKVYIKGTGELTKAPFFLKNKLKKEGLNLNEAYTIESVSLLKFRQPNHVDERVIAIRKKGSDKSGVSPSMFINQSFYREKIAGVISPFSDAAFRFYKFTYEGSFNEGKAEINKIRVTPRSRGDNVFEGTLFIIDGEWAIHSLDLKTSIMGFPIKVRQSYAEVAQNVWLPVSHRYQFEGSVLGFKGHYNYVAACRDYRVELNKDLLVKPRLIDEKIEEAPETIPEAKHQTKQQVQRSLADNERMSRKQFYRLLDRYEKQSAKADTELLVKTDRVFRIDSNATKLDSTYWESIRSIPLTNKELKGYRRDDSLAMIQSARLSGKDSLHVIKKKRFNALDLIGGGRYNISPRTVVAIDPTFTQVNFNTVEGVNVNLSGRLTYSYDSLRRKISFQPTVRYGFSSRDIYAKARFIYAMPAHNFAFEGGSFIQQFNADNPINPLINSLSSLLFKKNYMKLYQKEYFSIGWKYTPSAFFNVQVNAERALRTELYNANSYSLFYKDSRNYSPNAPENIELANTGKMLPVATTVSARIAYRPLRGYALYNGARRPLTDRSPEIILDYKKGIKGFLGSDVDFDRLELGLKHRLNVGAGNRLDFDLLGGSFLGKKALSFADFKHFDGNRTILTPLRPAGGYRLLDYYQFSTAGTYFSGNVHYAFRKFLLTRLPAVRYRGIRENLFVNYLKTSYSPNYFEVGYSLDNVFRLFRVEVASSFYNGNYKETGVRVGIATVFRFNSDD